MKEKLENFIASVKLRQAHALVIAAASIVTVIVIGAFAFSPIGKSDAEDTAIDELVDSHSPGLEDPIVVVVGEEDSSIVGNAVSNNSWPGEIISLNNLQVQPDREGTIREWYVRIGERVHSGQVIGKLSRPPQTPEMVSMLSEKLEELSDTRTKLVSLRTYTKKRISQLQQLRIDTESSNKQKMDLLGSNASGREGAALTSIASKKKLAQVVLRGSITRILPMISSQSNIPSLGLISSIQLRSGIGALDLGLRSNFSATLLKALADSKDASLLSEQSGSLYFDSAIRLANASFADGEMLFEADLTSLKQMLVEDQLEFFAILGEIRAMELERVNTERESIDTLAEIDAMIAELEKELAMSEGELIAKEEAYASVSGSITGGYSIVAPNSGVVSSIMKKPGEFVGPGMPVATVSAESSDKTLVRMSMPNNIKKPMVGQLLSIVRPGFGTDVQKIRLVGVGSSLDNDGSYMADAVFVGSTKWPVGASVRILAPASSSVVFVKHASVLWSADNTPTVWAVSEADRIFKKKIVIGRMLGPLIEVYEGLKNGERYIANPSPELREDMLLSDIMKLVPRKDSDEPPASKSKEHDSMPGM